MGDATFSRLMSKGKKTQGSPSASLGATLGSECAMPLALNGNGSYWPTPVPGPKLCLGPGGKRDGEVSNSSVTSTKTGHATHGFGASASNRGSVSVFRKATSAALSSALSWRPSGGCFARLGSSVEVRFTPEL